MSNIFLAQKNDNEKISKLFEKLNTQNYNFSDINDINSYIEKKKCYIVKNDDGEIVASMIIQICEGNCELKLISSDEKGAGKMLIDFLKEKCKQEKISKIWCWSLVRYNAKGFYEKMGFNEFFLLKKQWYDEDCYIFGLELNK